MKEIYRLISLWNEEKNTCYSPILHDDGSISIINTKTKAVQMMFTDIDDALKNLAL
jgi:hypothetical protein